MNEENKETGLEEKEKGKENGSLKKKEKKVSKKDEKIAELTNLVQHIQADFENYKKRTELEKANLVKNGNRELITGLLPILDSFELALKNKKEKEEFINGIELIYAQFHEILKKEGLERIETKRFDPYIHEALMQKESDEEDGTILEELQKGYMLNKSILRPAKVTVAKKVVQNEAKAEHNNNKTYA